MRRALKLRVVSCFSRKICNSSLLREGVLYMHEMLREMYKVYSKFNAVKFLLLAVGAIVSGVYYAYVVSVDGYLWLFVLATLILSFVVVRSARKFLSGKMKTGDLIGNVFTAGLIGYFLVILAMAIIKA